MTNDHKMKQSLVQ